MPPNTKNLSTNENVEQNIHIIVDNTVPDWNDLDIPVLIQIQILIYRKRLVFHPAHIF